MNPICGPLRSSDHLLLTSSVSLRRRRSLRMAGGQRTIFCGHAWFQSAAENGLRMNVIYKGINEEVLDPASLVQGTDFVAEVTLYNPGTRGSYQELALTQIFPSGWEILNTRLYNLDQFYAEDRPEYQDIRDDRVFTYFNLSPGEEKTFRVLLTATYAGDYYLPAASCEAMYDRSIYARKKGQAVSVVKAAAR